MEPGTWIGSRAQSVRSMGGAGELRVEGLIEVIACAYLVGLERSSARDTNGLAQLTPEPHADHLRVDCRTALMASPAWLGGTIAGSAGPQGCARSPSACARSRWCSAVAESGDQSA